MKNRSGTLLILLISHLCFGDDLADKMTELGFVERNPPERGSDEWRKANFSSPAYIVQVTNAISARKPSREESGKSDVLFEAKNVRYIGIDHGEFGGGLYLNSYEKDKKPFFCGNIRALVPIKKDLYVIEGLAHLGLNRGSVHAIRDYETPSKPERVTLLPSAPEAVLVDEIRGRTQIVIVGHDNFMIFSPDSQLEVIHHDTFWGGLYPSSVVKYENYYLIGIRSGVAAVTASPFSKNIIRYFTNSESLPSETLQLLDKMKKHSQVE